MHLLLLVSVALLVLGHVPPGNVTSVEERIQTVLEGPRGLLNLLHEARDLHALVSRRLPVLSLPRPQEPSGPQR
ncbi:hypothetical protein MC885_018846 [Smutsia gigantea]|nr:hypothetical protein MC885_018846 [Smutsia gigantea]